MTGQPTSRADRATPPAHAGTTAGILTALVLLPMSPAMSQSKASRCRVLGVEGNVIEIDGIDAFADTPVLDIKP